MRKSSSFVVSLFLFSLLFVASSQAASIFDLGSSWKYFVGTQEASTPQSAWRAINFNDSSWLIGPAPIGYGEPVGSTVPTSTLSVYHRKAFVVANVSQITRLDIIIRIDDGFVAWINGTEIGRYNVPAGDLAFNAVSPTAIEPESRVVTVTNPAAILVPGTNVIAIHSFNQSAGSSDIYMDASLATVLGETVAPTITSFSPSGGATLTNLNQVSVTFSEPVNGVNAGDLLVNGQPASSLTIGTNNTYVFSFVQPAYGTVQVSWVNGHGIEDLAFPPNPFNATAPGATWQYALQDRAAPVVSGIAPQPGFTIRSLSQVEISFSEPVRGVDAGDLRINGTAAAAVSSTDPSRYTFTFPQPAAGTVQVAWNPSHGISDLASPSNNFVAGASWSYVLNPNAALPDVIITEFLAAQADTKAPASELRDEDGDAEDWIEIFNSGEVAVDLRGWSLTDSANNLRKWSFPQTNLAAKAYMIIFASEKDRDTPGRTLHTNFKLGNNGEYLALVKPDGTIASQYAPTYPPQVADVSFGFPTLTTTSNAITANSLATAFVPADNSLALDWALQIFNDAAWIRATNGVGYEAAGSPAPSLRSFIKTDVQSQMLGKNPGIFVRIPFVVADAAKLSALTLRLRYDDGVVGYINGREVLRVNAPSNEFNTPLFFNDRATVQRANNLSTNLEDFDLTFAVRQGGVQTGTNVLAFHALNAAPDDGDFLVAAELIGTTRDIQLMQTRYFPTPTPGADNGPGTAALGPIISDEDHTPKVPQDNEDIVVTARVSPTFSPVSQVTVTYRVMFGVETVISMLDDGQHNDGAANDGVFGATLPIAALSTPGQMVRWFFRATDTQARSGRLPLFADPLNSAQYFGTIVFLAQTNNLPIFHWFMPNPEAAGTDAGQRGSIFYLNEFYDNVNANVHGQSSRSFPKHSYDVDFPGNVFKYQEGADRVDDINLLTTYPDKAKMRNMLSYATYRDAGGEYHYVVPIRIHTNGGFFGDWHIVENGDANYIKRLGKDPNGAFYKMYNMFVDTTDYTISGAEAEKKTRKTENNADIKALFEGLVSAPAATKTNFMFDNLNIPQMVNFLAAKVVTADGDCCHKNYYFYRDTEGTGEWEGFPWDVDLSWGRQWNGTDNYWNHNLIGTNLNGLNVGGNNGVFREVLTGNPQTQQMYLRRVRTIMDEQLGNTNSMNTNFEAQIAYWLKLIEPDANVDAQKWPFSITWGNAAGAGTATSTCCTQTMGQAAAELTNLYLPARRRYMYGLGVPAAQPTNAAVDIRSIEHSPGNANQAQEYIELVNTNTYAVDISGWKLAGAVKHTFRGGTVIPINGRLYVSPDVKAFRARASGPRGGLGLFVQGNYEGQLSARGESIYLTNKFGRAVSSLTYTGTPSLAQQYLRITEVMYHAAPATAPFQLDDFDYIELKNIGPVAVPLVGVHFTNGIDFTFTALSAVTSLNPGQRIVLVKNTAAFVSRYGSSATIAGVYGGSLDNAGERIKLDDALNDKIIEFDYNNSWYPITDGLGLSLVIVNENAPFDTWDLKESWRPSADGGSPGAGDSPAVTNAPIRVNEVLTHTDLPAVDRIELFNPTTSAVNIGGWYISDDFFTPKKFRIPAGTMIAAGGYATFSEANFNTPSNAPTSFSFSSEGDEAYIFSADATGNLTAYYHGFNFGAAENGTSFGRYITSTGLTQFVAQASQTFGASNSLPKVGPIVISEIMYHPPDIGGADNSADEYIELHNVTTTNVPLYHLTNGWELRDAVDFVFKVNQSIPAGGFLVVVNFNPTNTAQLARFRARYNLATNVAVVGPFGGKLDNSDDSIELFRPDAPDVDSVPYILVERVHYYTTNGWDSLADGIGLSLHRKDIRAFGNDPINWVAAAPTGGGAFTPTTAPVITQQPVGIPLVAENVSTNLSVVATGTGLAYQWSFNGQTLSNAYTAVLSLPNLRLDQRGNYSVAVFNGGGVVFSSNAFVNVRPAPSITQQPQNVRTNQGSNALFTVVASTSGTARYQWRFNGTNIVGATNSSLLLTNVQLDTHPGFYDVRVTDDVGSTLSQTNVFHVLVAPRITNSPPTSLIGVQGQDMAFSIVAGPDYPMLPLSIRWLRQGATYILNGPQTVIYTNLQANPTIVRVAVTNLAGSTATANINVFLLPDTDGDGVPDDWEIANGFNPTNSVDGLLDTDGDGMRNRDEFQAGTNPRDSNSVLRTSIMASNGVILQFSAQSSNFYVVQYRANSQTGQWFTLSNVPPTGSIQPVQVFDSGAGGNQRFYRIGTFLVP